MWRPTSPAPLHSRTRRSQGKAECVATPAKKQPSCARGSPSTDPRKRPEAVELAIATRTWERLSPSRIKHLEGQLRVTRRKETSSVAAGKSTCLQGSSQPSSRPSHLGAVLAPAPDWLHSALWGKTWQSFSVIETFVYVIIKKSRKLYCLFLSIL